MKCSNCNTEYEGAYCPNCGNKKIETESQKIRNVFYDKSENLVCLLGNRYVQTFLSKGVLGKGFAILSDKRLYFKGKCLIRSRSGFYSKYSEQAVDITDITGTGYVQSKATCLLLAILWLNCKNSEHTCNQNDAGVFYFYTCVSKANIYICTYKLKTIHLLLVP